jgi:hypothetical protein
LQGDGGLIADGGIIVNFLQVDSPIDRTAIGSGTTHIPAVSYTLTCPNGIETLNTTEDVKWLSWPADPVLVNDDGATISGRWERTDDEGSKVSEWNLKSMREP